MYSYSVVLLSVSKYSLTQALYALQSSVELNYKYTQFLKRKFGYCPLVEVSSARFRQIKRFPIKRSRVSVIKSPFVYKKSGESFIFSYYKGGFTINLSSKSPLNTYKLKGILAFLLRNRSVPAVFSNVELRVVSLEGNYDLVQKL